MKILIVNDDGINGRGIIALAKEIAKKHEVVVVAPREEKSASSHSISIHNPIRIREENLDDSFKAYSLVGTPADCTQAGLLLIGKDIDLVLSGINRGLNCGTDVLYSGTVSAAIEGSICGYPSIAFSMEVEWTKKDEDYTKAAKWANKIVDMAENNYLRKNVVLNVNIPKVNEEDIKGLKVCKLGKAVYKTEYLLIEDNEDKVYEIKGIMNEVEKGETDTYYLKEGYVTLTPLQYDFTNFNTIEKIKTIFE
ncbi:5'/3'-nucleotidase SurE [Clostridium sp.]|uniref:5'/3'-nucleotidase SurE n=1 Tax=Clostridium sp. TaxID=1506 RepID=UPI002635D46F|nr:5'/3'-nucleotidase SurE [Clostridium sp.]